MQVVEDIGQVAPDPKSATSHLVALALGHESFATTARYYARTERSKARSRSAS